MFTKLELEEIAANAVEAACKATNNVEVVARVAQALVGGVMAERIGITMLQENKRIMDLEELGARVSSKGQPT